jgi:hypothetical protein
MGSFKYTCAYGPSQKSRGEGGVKDGVEKNFVIGKGNEHVQHNLFVSSY